MAKITWSGAAADDNFFNPANWIGGVVPGSADDAVIPAGFIVQVTGGGAVNTLSVAASSTVTIENSQSFTIGGTGASTNAGRIVVNDNATLTLDGTLLGAGTLSLASLGNNTNLAIGPAGATLAGGVVVLGDGGTNRIYGASGSVALTNLGTIEGGGQLGIGQLTLVNGGVIDATGTTTQLALNAATTNTGTIEATGPAGLHIQSTVANQGGLIEAVGVSAVVLENSDDIIGGTLATRSGGVITLNNSQSGTLDGSAGSIANTGTFQLKDNSSLAVYGTLHNTGTIVLASGGNNTNLIAAGPTVTLNGGGTVVLGDASSVNRIYGASGADVLVNVDNLIEGSGQIGANQLTFVNDATIDATGVANAIIIDAAVTNNGLIEATGMAGLQIVSTVLNTSGTIAALGTSTVTLSGGDDIVGGRISSAPGALVQLLNSNNGTLDASTSAITLAGNVRVDDNAALNLYGTIHNTGTIALASAGNNTDLVAEGTSVTLDGGGTIILGDVSPNNRIYGASGTNVLTNVNNLIEGSGQLGVGQLTFVNDGTIDATGTANALVVNALVTNNSLIEATGSAGLQIVSTVLNTHGTIAAFGTSSVVFGSGEYVAGGTISSAPGAVVQLTNSNAGTLDGSASAVTLAGNFRIDDNASLALYGTIHNTGTIALASAGNDTNLVVAGTAVTLDGGGTIVLGDGSGSNRLYANSGADVLTNVDNVIEGSGQIGGGQLNLVNDATVDATGVANALIINAAVTNNGLIEATGAAGLQIQSTVLNARGTIQALGTSTVTLDGGEDIIGGTITSSAGALIFLNNSNTGTLDGSTGALTNAGHFQVNDNATLNLFGTIHNTGTIALASLGNNTNLVVQSQTVSLTGGGTVVLGDGSTVNRLYGGSGAFTLNNAGNTIEGAGQVGAGQLNITNAGTIAATGTNALVVDPGGADTVLNSASGLIEAVGTSDLVLQDGTFTNLGTYVDVTMQNGAVLSNDTGGVLTGGTYEALAGATLQIEGAPITTLDATAILAGPGAVIDTPPSTVANTLATIGAGGVLAIEGGDVFTAANAITNAGIIRLDVGAFSGALANSGTVDGTGTLAGSVLNTGTIIADHGTLVVTPAVAGDLVIAGAGGELELGGADSAGTVSFAGSGETLRLDALPGFNATVAGLTPGDKILLPGQTVSSASLLGSTLRIVTNAGTYTEALAAPLPGDRAAVVGGNTIEIFREAVASAADTSSVSFGDVHVGDTDSAALTITNTAAADGLSENLDATVSGSPPAGGSGSVSLLAPGASNDTGLHVTLSTATAGAIAGNATIALSSDGAGVDGLGATSIGSQNVAVSGKVFALAADTTLVKTIDLGTVHVGDGIAGTVAVVNTATGAAGYVENLDATGVVTGSGFSGGNTLTGIAAGSRGQLTYALSTAASAKDVATLSVALTSDGTGIDTLGTTALTGQTVALSAVVDNYAVASVSKTAGAGTLTQTTGGYTLDLGTLTQGSSPESDTLTILNGALGPYADTLSGSLLTAGTSSFTDAGFGAFSGATFGSVADTGTITLDTSKSGFFVETLTLTSSSDNPSSSTALAPIVITVEGTVAAPCFVTGTLIRTTSGEVAVEDLRIGDEIVTLIGARSRPVVWLGRRRVHCDRHPDRRLADPVRVRAGAFGATPTTDLFLSPDHAVYFDGKLTPIHLLVDGRTIVQEPRSMVTYHHVELDSHDVILAHGLPTESYLDTGNRHRFANAPIVSLHPRFESSEAGDPCVQMILDGERLEQIRRRRLALLRPSPSGRQRSPRIRA